MKPDPRLRLRHIRCFLEAARAGSLAEAAETLLITQPAVSKTIRELEAILGAELFDRSARKIRLNEAGRMFQIHGGAALADLMRAERAVKAATGAAVKLHVGALPTAATDLFPRAATEFAESHKHCLIHVTTGPNWLLLSQLREARLDIVIGRMAEPELMTGLGFEQLYSEDVILTCGPDHPLCGEKQAPRRIGDYPMILPPKGALIHQTVRNYLASIGLPGIRPRFETVSLAFGRKAVQLSDALWFISRGVVADELAAGTLGQIPLDAPMLAGPVGISIREDAPPSPERDDLIASLRDVAREER